MEKTAVEYLIEQLEFALPDIEWSNYRNETDKALEMEKQQLIDFYCHTNTDDVILKEFAEQHYNKTFNK
jgi:hypothetical protein